MSAKLAIDNIADSISELSDRRLRELARGAAPTTPLLSNQSYVQEACVHFLEQVQLEREDRWALPRRWLLFAALQQRYADSRVSRDAADFEILEIQKRIKAFQDLRNGGRGARNFYREHGASTLLLQQRLQDECTHFAGLIKSLQKGESNNLLEICAVQYGGYSSNELVARCYQQAFIVGADEGWQGLREALGELPDLWRKFKPIAVPLYESQGLQTYMRNAHSDDFKRLARLARATDLNYPDWPSARDIMYDIFHYPNATDDLIARFAEPLLVADYEPQWWAAQMRWAVSKKDTGSPLSLTIKHPLPATSAEQVWVMLARRWAMRSALDPNDSEDPRAPRLIRATATVEGILSLWQELSERRLRARLEVVLRAASGAVLEVSFGMRLKGVPVLAQVWYGLKLPNAWDGDRELADFLMAQLPSRLPLDQIPFSSRRSPEEHALPVSTVFDYELLPPVLNTALDESFLLNYITRAESCIHNDAQWRISAGAPAGVILGCRDCARSRVAFVPLRSLARKDRNQFDLQDQNKSPFDDIDSEDRAIDLLRALSPRGLSWEYIDQERLLDPAIYRLASGGGILSPEGAALPRSLGEIFRRGGTARSGHGG